MKYRIDIDCSPGDPRPDDLIGNVTKGTGLPPREDVTCRLFGWWTWDYSDIAPDVWKHARPKIRRRLVRLYEQGVIRYGRVSLAKGEERPGSPQETDAGVPDRSMEAETSNQPCDDDTFAMLSLERFVTLASGVVLAGVSLVTGTVGSKEC